MLCKWGSNETSSTTWDHKTDPVIQCQLKHVSLQITWINNSVHKHCKRLPISFSINYKSCKQIEQLLWYNRMHRPSVHVNTFIMKRFDPFLTCETYALSFLFALVHYAYASIEVVYLILTKSTIRVDVTMLIVKLGYLVV